jgi:leucine dehydrogenase
MRLGRASLEGLKVAVQGLGGVGYPLCRLLAAEGALLYVADTRPAVLDARSIPTLRARVVAGAANNQLAREYQGGAARARFPQA